jgi:hypothetical protein
MAKPSKTPLIQEFISMNNGKIFSTKEMCKEIGVSLPTLLAFIKNNPDFFSSMSYGVYKIEVNTQATY